MMVRGPANAVLQELESVDCIASGDQSIDLRLVERILNTPVFLRSGRLSGFLQYICGEVAAGHGDELNELQIGIAVFGRSPDYDPTVDSIVRSHATRLRQKLREHFDTAGLDEPYILTIPKGGYLPRMEPRPRTYEDLRQESRQDARQDLLVEEGFHPPPASTFGAVSPGLGPVPPVGEREAARNSTHWKLRLYQAATLACALLAITFGWLLWQAKHATQRPAHPLWSGFLDARQGRTLIVQSDSGLVLSQHLSGRAVELSEYVGEGYGRMSTSDNKADALASRLARKRYTPALDSTVYEHLAKYLDHPDQNITNRFARDLRLDELKQANAVLLGSHESDPWVSLFEPGMNFLFRSDLRDGLATIVNRRPKAGEQAEYRMRKDDPDRIVYGLLAYRPNLNHTGNVLIVEGQTTAGTQTSLDFLFNDTQLLPFLDSIRGGRDIPHFEVLLRSSSVAGQSSKIEVVAYRATRD